MSVQTGAITVIFEGGDPTRSFYVNGEEYGPVNREMRLPAGTYFIDLGLPRNYTPATTRVSIDEGGDHTVTFTPQE